MKRLTMPVHSGLMFTLGCLASTATLATDPLAAINLSDPATVQWRIVGRCMVSPRVEHWIPLAWVETSPSGQHSFIDGTPTADGKTSVLRSSGLESSNSARILNFTNNLWRASNIANSLQQQVCNVWDASLQAPPASTSATADCESSSAIAVGLKQFDDLFRSVTTPLMTLAYDSTRDSGWTSGCRDKTLMEQATASNMRCDTEMLSPDLQPGGAAASAAATKYCVGRWGSLIPRQSREIGLTGPAASAKSAYRAMSTARNHLNRFPYPVDTAGKMQLAAPNPSPSFTPGDRPLPSSIQPNGAKVYAWIYWRKVTCCVGD
ncbi:hypothetical protein RQP54_18315 [Curvibacter sp. APW13]|uniref:hypothetical protein n=1 Tax=Curvibacter sp. APW13 TaxID=3077236 RepID=UPI0028E01C48|nr:hypothetical protein [Curvibacter sp. APW13]MDT8992834.1 hypothetical protein [Curvibacter sp. APW13]